MFIAIRVVSYASKYTHTHNYTNVCQYGIETLIRTDHIDAYIHADV